MIYHCSFICNSFFLMWYINIFLPAEMLYFKFGLALPLNYHKDNLLVSVFLACLPPQWCLQCLLFPESTKRLQSDSDIDWTGSHASSDTHGTVFRIYYNVSSMNGEWRYESDVGIRRRFTCNLTYFFKISSEKNSISHLGFKFHF